MSVGAIIALEELDSFVRDKIPGESLYDVFRQSDYRGNVEQHVRAALEEPFLADRSQSEKGDYACADYRRGLQSPADHSFCNYLIYFHDLCGGSA